MKPSNDVYFSVSDFTQRLILDESPSNARRSPCCTHRQRNGDISLHLTRSVIFSGNALISDFRWCATRLFIYHHFTIKGDKAELSFADATAWRLEHIAHPYQNSLISFLLRQSGKVFARIWFSKCLQRERDDHSSTISIIRISFVHDWMTC